MVISNHNSFRVLFDKIVSVYFIWKIYLNILALEMAIPGNQHRANCIGTLSFPIESYIADKPRPPPLSVQLRLRRCNVEENSLSRTPASCGRLRTRLRSRRVCHEERKRRREGEKSVYLPSCKRRCWCHRQWTLSMSRGCQLSPLAGSSSWGQSVTRTHTHDCHAISVTFSLSITLYYYYYYFITPVGSTN